MDEPDWKHPKLQALLGARARLSIELQIIEDLLNNPEYQPTCLDMEYWHETHDKIVELLECVNTVRCKEKSLIK